MKPNQMNRRQFLRGTAVLTGAAMLSRSWDLKGLAQATAPAVRRTATDIVTLNKTGIKLSRLGIGTGVNNGMDNLAGGKDAFIKTIRHAIDQGITYIDAAQRYETFSVVGEAIKGVDREKLFIQTKIWPGDAPDVLAGIDKHRKNFNTDYIDSLLIHCRTEANWTDRYKAMMDSYEEAKSRKWIRAKGVSCHSFTALQLANKSDWPDVHLVRVNPQGLIIDGPNGGWNDQARNPVEPVIDQIQQMHDKGRGVIGMKIFGNGFIKDPAEQQRSIRYAMSHSSIDAIVIGMTTPQQVDTNIKMINQVLATV